MILIGLMGAKGAGKDTFFEYARESYSGTFSRFAFADAIRDEVEAAFSVSPIMLADPVLKENPLDELSLVACEDQGFVESMLRVHGEYLSMVEPRSPRWIMQQWGTEYRRSQNPHYWTFQFSRFYRQSMIDGVDFLVVTDVRFPDEIDTVLSHGGSLVAIRNEDAESKINAMSHVSELHWKREKRRIDITNPFPDKARQNEFKMAVSDYILSCLG